MSSTVGAIDGRVSWMGRVDRVRRLFEHLLLTTVNHDVQIARLCNLHEAHVYCVINGISAQQYGPLLEKYILTKYKYVKNSATDCAGDGYRDGQNVEIKVSLGGITHTKFNYVQIRPMHYCDIYILTAWHLSVDNLASEGELYVFKIPKEAMMAIIVGFGSYAHGTVREHGVITSETVGCKKNIREYALRPVIGDECWNTLMLFRIDENDI